MNETKKEWQIVVGPNWIREGNVDAPLVSRGEQRPVLHPKSLRPLRWFVGAGLVIGFLLYALYWLAEVLERLQGL